MESNLSPLDILQQIQSTDLAKVETDFPNLATGNVATTIVAAAWDTSTDKPFLGLTYELTQPWKTQAHGDVASKAVNPGDRGAKFNQRIYVGQYEDGQTHETKVYGLDSVAKLFKAVFGKDTTIKADTEGVMQLLGMPVVATLKFDPAPRNKKTGEVFGPKTEVTGWVGVKR